MDAKNIREEIIRSTGADPSKCMRCGKCSASCPSYDEMEYHPHNFAYIIEQGDMAKIEKLALSDSVYKCLSCMVCNERCPRGVKPGAIVEAVRNMVIRQKENNHLSSDEIPALLDDELPQQAIVTAMRKYSK